MTTTISAACLALLAAVEVSFPPGAAAPPHTHPRHRVLPQAK